MQNRRECLYSLKKGDIRFNLTISYLSDDFKIFLFKEILNVTSIKKTNEGLIINSISSDGITCRNVFQWFLCPTIIYSQLLYPDFVFDLLSKKNFFTYGGDSDGE